MSRNKPLAQWTEAEKRTAVSRAFASTVRPDPRLSTSAHGAAQTVPARRRPD